MAKRKLVSWIDSFVEYTEGTSSPSLFCKWAAIATIAGALERRVWTYTMGSNLYPNMYIILCGPPGVGKTELTKIVWQLWHGIPNHYTAANSLSSAALVDELREASRNIVQPGMPMMSFNSLKISSNELGVLLPSYESDFMNKLTDIYDGHPYGERRRGGEGKHTFQLERPQINMVAACTPGYMTGTIPEGAWDQGFMSRCVLIFSGEKRKTSLFARKDRNKTLFNNLREDLMTMGSDALCGELKFTPEAAELIDAFNLSGGEPAPTHPKLVGYNARRVAHMLKLMQVSCIDRGEDFVIEEIDFQNALDWLMEAEFFMPEIFKAMSSGGDGRVIEDTWHFLFSIYIKNKQPIPKHKLWAFLQDRTPSYNIANIEKTMVSSGLLKAQVVKDVGTCYIPAAKDPKF